MGGGGVESFVVVIVPVLVTFKAMNMANEPEKVDYTMTKSSPKMKLYTVCGKF